MKIVYVFMGPICSGKSSVCKMFSDDVTVIDFDKITHMEAHCNVPIIKSVISKIKKIVDKCDDGSVIAVDGWFSFWGSWWKKPHEERHMGQCIQGTLMDLQIALKDCEIFPIIVSRNAERLVSDLDEKCTDNGGDKMRYVDYRNQLQQKLSVYYDEVSKFIEGK